MRSLQSLMPRRWARLGAVGIATCALGVGTVTLLVREEPTPPQRPATVPVARSSTTPVVAPVVTSSATPPAPTRPAPTTVAEAAAARVPSDLATWVADRSLEPRLRYTALRRLETQDPVEAVTAALAVLDDVQPLVRLNAIALLTRSKDPRAQTALAQLDDRSRRLAGALARR